MDRTYSSKPGVTVNSDQSLVRIEALARLMDGAFVIPGTDIRMGLDAVIGLVPGIGDVVSGVISSYLIWEARRLGAPRWLIARMMGNTLLDTTIGSIPIIGDAFDIMFRANMKNMVLLRNHLAAKGGGARTAAPSSRATLLELSRRCSPSNEAAWEPTSLVRVYDGAQARTLAAFHRSVMTSGCSPAALFARLTSQGGADEEQLIGNDESASASGSSNPRVDSDWSDCRRWTVPCSLPV